MGGREERCGVCECGQRGSECDASAGYARHRVRGARIMKACNKNRFDSSALMFS